MALPGATIGGHKLEWESWGIFFPAVGANVALPGATIGGHKFEWEVGPHRKNFPFVTREVTQTKYFNFTQPGGTVS